MTFCQYIILSYIDQKNNWGMGGSLIVFKRISLFTKASRLDSGFHRNDEEIATSLHSSQ